MVKKKTDERRPCIYCARNKITSKYYVGQTRFGLKHRQNQHFDRAFKKFRKTKFCKVLRKFGKETFVWETLYVVRKDDLTPQQLQSLLNMREKAWVKYFNSFRNGYNQDEGGTGGVRYKYATLEEKRKAQNRLQKTRRDNNKEAYKEQCRQRRQVRGEAYRKQRRNYIQHKLKNNPELKERLKVNHIEYMKNNRQQRKEYRDWKETLNPEIKENRLAKHREYMKDNQQKRRAAKIAKIGHEAYRAKFNERRRKRKEQKLLETNI